MLYKKILKSSFLCIPCVSAKWIENLQDNKKIGLATFIHLAFSAIFSIALGVCSGIIIYITYYFMTHNHLDLSHFSISTVSFVLLYFVILILIIFQNIFDQKFNPQKVVKQTISALLHNTSAEKLGLSLFIVPVILLVTFGTISIILMFCLYPFLLNIFPSQNMIMTFLICCCMVIILFIFIYGTFDNYKRIKRKLLLFSVSSLVVFGVTYFTVVDLYSIEFSKMQQFDLLKAIAAVFALILSFDRLISTFRELIKSYEEDIKEKSPCQQCLKCKAVRYTPRRTFIAINVYRIRIIKRIRNSYRTFKKLTFRNKLLLMIASLCTVAFLLYSYSSEKALNLNIELDKRVNSFLSPIFEAASPIIGYIVISGVVLVCLIHGIVSFIDFFRIVTSEWRLKKSFKYFLVNIIYKCPEKLFSGIAAMVFFVALILVFFKIYFLIIILQCVTLISIIPLLMFCLRWLFNKVEKYKSIE